VKIYGCSLVFGLSLGLTAYCNSRYAPEIVIGIFSRSVHQQVSLLVHEILPIVFTHFEIRGELNGVGRTRFLTETAEDTSREIDSEKIRKASPVLILSGLQRDAIYRADNCTKIASNAALTAIRIARQYDSTAIPGGQIGLLFWILDGHATAKSMLENLPQAKQYAEHVKSPASRKHEHNSTRHKQIE
jgi:hypothetical protein